MIGNSVKTFFAFVFLFTCVDALAICSSSNYTYSYNISPTTIVVPQHKTPGPIGSVISVPAGTSVTVNCSGGNSSTQWITILTLNPVMEISSYSQDVYKTNVPGIGVKVWNDFINGNITLSNQLQKWYAFGSGNSVSSGNWLTNIKMQFYVTGPVTPGTVQLPSPFIQAWSNNIVSQAGGTVYNTLNIPTKINVVVPTCETSNLKVNMGEHDISEFSGLNSTSHEVPFSFEVKNCSTQLNSVSWMLEPGPGISVIGTGNQQYLTLNSSSDANGVGLQVLTANDNKPVTFYQMSKINTGNTVLPAYSMSMKARYIKIQNIVSGGVANSSIVVTMSYQ